MYKIFLAQHVIDDHIPALPKTIKKRIKFAIDERLAVSPIHFGKPLRYSLKGYRRLRVGDYRVIYKVDERHKSVYIIVIKHRKAVYE